MNRQQVIAPHSEIREVLFDVSGSTLPTAYQFGLWEELFRIVPQLGEYEHVGVLPLRTAASNEGMLLPKRAKLVLRIPPVLVVDVCDLAHKEINIMGVTLQLGSCKIRPLHPSPTLHSELVTGAEDEIVFMAHIGSDLATLGIKSKLICGRRQIINGSDRSIIGYSLVLHDLTPEDSLRIQYLGLGEERKLGCGVFVPYKNISGLN